LGLRRTVAAGTGKVMFGFMGKKVFKKEDFAVFERGIVRLSAKLARAVAEVVIKSFPLVKYIDEVKEV
jgi:hypothetical protein